MSDAEQGRVILVLNNPALGREVQGMAWFHLRFAGPESDDALRAAGTAELIARSVAEFVETVEAQLLESSRRQDLDAVYANANPLGDGTQESGGDRSVSS